MMTQNDLLKSTGFLREAICSPWLFVPALQIGDSGHKEPGEGATQQTVPCSSDPTVIGSVLEFTSEDEEGGEGGNGNMEHQLPRVPQTEQVGVA